MPNEQRLVIYHAGCPDGFAAAWAVWQKYGGNPATYVPWQYGQDPPKVNKTTDLIIVDFSFKRTEMETLISESHSLLCLDHHKTAETELQDLPGCFFDMNRSGAAMAWDYFHADLIPRPWVIDYVQDRDLWQWKLRKSKEVSAWIMAQPHEFWAWNQLHKEGLETAIGLGSAIRLHIAHYCEHFLKHVRRGTVGGIEMPTVNAPMFNVSDLLHVICEQEQAMNDLENIKVPVAACAWWFRGDGNVQHSLRSIGDLDVAEIAKSFGGGGHKNASGFESENCEVRFSVS